MSEKYVVIATFTLPTEAHLACGRLSAEGIPAHVSGDLASSAFGGFGAIGGRVELYVPESASERALDVLAECMPGEQWRVRFNKEATKDQAPTADWPAEERVRARSEGVQPEGDTRLWVCTLCGDAVPVKETVCPSCGTARGAVQPEEQEERPGKRRSRRAARSEIQKYPRVAKGASLDAGLEARKADEYPRSELLAGRALLAVMAALIAIAVSTFGGWCVMIVVTPPAVIVSLGCLIQLMTYSGDLTPKATWKCYAALALNIVVVGVALMLIWIRMYGVLLLR
jgi:hypothetical protein